MVTRAAVSPVMVTKPTIIFRQLVRWLTLACALSFGTLAFGADHVQWLGYSNVSPQGFSVAAQVDEPILSVTARVFVDSMATNEVSDQLIIGGSQRPELAEQGLVLVTIANTLVDSSYFLQLEVQTATGNYFLPNALPLLEIRTAKNRRSFLESNQLQLNSLNSMVTVEPIAGMQSIVYVGTASMASPLAAVSSNATVYFDLNNANDSLGERVLIAETEAISVTEYFGKQCAPETELIRYRKIPTATPVSVALSYTPLESCFFADLNCDSYIDATDSDAIRYSMLQQADTCSFNPDANIVNDNIINVLDLQSILNRDGQSGPFQ